ncbi:MAG: carbamoyltransferase [Gemmatimonadetes bacterium]|nr:MAG: carbamoyltransferase [Gemmatimonadota bacterium]
MILGFSSFWHDSAAALIDDSGQLVAAIEEERLSRIKHDGAFPVKAIQFCLDFAGIQESDLDAVSYYRLPRLNVHHQLVHFLRCFPRSLQSLRDQSEWISEWRKMLRVRSNLKRHFPVLAHQPFIPVDHPTAHAASAFFPSPFTEAVVLVHDAMGEWAATTVFEGRHGNLTRLLQINFPHSLGVFYQTLTMFLGFNIRNDEYKVMGLSAYGKPRYLDTFQEMIRLTGEPGYRLNLRFFQFQYGTKPYWSPLLEEKLGPPRLPGEELTERHADIACSLQTRLQEVVLHLVTAIFSRTKTRNLCIAGGVGLNSVLNGVLLEKSPVSHLYVPSVAGDAGASWGSALMAHRRLQKCTSFRPVYRADWGPSFSDEAIERILQERHISYQRVEHVPRFCASKLAEGWTLGWFQGRMEWGPRALGQRSILADPRRAEMKDIINKKVKGREPFRPFAPSVLESHFADYFIAPNADPFPFMTTVFRVKPEKQSEIPAVVHVDGTARVQTVSANLQPLYAGLIHEFYQLTGVPLILNTSFNDNGVPIVCTPQEALDVFQRTGLDGLMIGAFWIAKP